MPTSDDFRAGLDTSTLWTTTNTPTGTSISAGDDTTDWYVDIATTDSNDHDHYGTLANTPYILQSLGSGAWDVRIRVLNAPNQQYEGFGFLLKDSTDAFKYCRLDFNWNGSAYFIYCLERYNSGSGKRNPFATVTLSTTFYPYFRCTYNGSGTYQVYTSSDGSSWTSRASFGLISVTPDQIGMATNSSSSSNGYAPLYDFFEDYTNDPISGEDSGGGTAVDLAAGSYTLTGNAIGITFERNVDLGAGTYSLTGHDITVSYTTPVDLDAGSYTVTGYDLALTFDRAVDLDAGSYALIGNALGLTFETAVDLDAGSYTVTGYDLSIQTGTGVSLDAGSYTVTGYDLGITFVRAVDLAAGSYTVTGYDLSIELAGITNVNLEAGSYTLTGFDLTVALDRSVDLAAGNYTFTGYDIGIPVTRAVDLDAGSYTVTGHDLTVDVDQPVSVDLGAGNFTLTGYPLGINVVSLSTRQPGGWLPRRVKPIIYVDQDGNPVDITAPVEEAIEAAPEAKKEPIRKAVERVTEQTKAPTVKAVGRAIQRIDAAAFKRFYEAERQRADDDDVAAILLLAA